MKYLFPSFFHASASHLVVSGLVITNLTAWWKHLHIQLLQLSAIKWCQNQPMRAQNYWTLTNHRRGFRRISYSCPISCSSLGVDMTSICLVFIQNLVPWSLHLPSCSCVDIIYYVGHLSCATLQVGLILHQNQPIGAEYLWQLTNHSMGNWFVWRLLLYGGCSLIMYWSTAVIRKLLSDVLLF